jgi:hypothetical protein
MANTVTNTSEKGGWSTKGTLGPPISAPGTGSWQFINGNFPLSVLLEGNYTGLSGSIMVSDQMPQPPDTQDGVALQSYSLVSMFTVMPYVITGPFRWCKFKTTAIAGGSMSPNIYAGGGGGAAT